MAVKKKTAKKKPAAVKKPATAKKVGAKKKTSATKPTISAEITAATQHNDEAARAMQGLGFRVRHVGSTISVEGDVTLWESTFGVRFKRRTKTLSPSVKQSYAKALTNNLRIPAALGHLITDVAFAEPPDFF